MSRTNFNSSTLVRLLAQATGAGAVAPRHDLAERLSLWLNAFDAIALHGIHQSAGADAPTPTGAAVQGAGRHAQLFAQAFERTRAGLLDLIRLQDRQPLHHKAATRGRAQATAPVASPPEPDAVPDFSQYFRRHLELQREMALRIAPLRAQARQVLVRSCPPLRPLAALDAQLEQTLGGREHKLLAQVPALLEKRFEQLRDTPGAGPAVFGREWQAIVRAELYLRLQPVVGLMQAWGASPQTTP